MGLHSDEATQAQLVTMLADKDPRTQRIACDSLVRAGRPVPPEKVIKLLRVRRPSRGLGGTAGP